MSFSVVTLLALLSFVCFGCVESSSNWAILYVDCRNGTDNLDCGESRGSPCRTLQFATVTRAGHIDSSHVTISVASGVCGEQSILVLDCSTSNNIKAWEFVGKNE